MSEVIVEIHMSLSRTRWRLVSPNSVSLPGRREVYARAANLQLVICPELTITMANGWVYRARGPRAQARGPGPPGSGPGPRARAMVPR